MTMPQKTTFDPATFLASEGVGRRIVHLRRSRSFSRKGVRLTVSFICRQAVRS
jgi:hypothetical protein